jgi:hypothetical protein
MVACAVLKLESKSEMSVKLHSNIISEATDGLVYARNGPLQQVRVLGMLASWNRKRLYLGSVVQPIVVV